MSELTEVIRPGQGRFAADADADADADAQAELIAELQARARFGMHPGLERTAWLLAQVGSPEQAFPAIHVAGTNGKGATAAAIAAILQSAGQRVGLFTSPHLVCPRERVVIGGQPIPAAPFVEAGQQVLRAADQMERERPQWGPATQFELYTALAFYAFAQAKVDVAVVEAGLGGRLDSTNVLQPMVSVLTPIGLDHREVLGPTLADIAREKAAILKPGGAWVIAPQPEEVLAAIRSRLRVVQGENSGRPAGASGPLIWVTSQDEPGACLTPDFAGGRELNPAGNAHNALWEVKCGRTDWAGTSFRVTIRPAAGGETTDQAWTIPLAGRHQAVNGAVALAAATVAGSRLGLGRSVAADLLQNGLTHLSWPGRLEEVARNPRVVLDGAHNPPAARVLAQALADLKPSRPLVLVFGILAAKQWQPVLAALLPFADGLVATAPLQPRTPAVAPVVLADYARQTLTRERVSVAADPQAAVEQARRWAGAKGTVLVCGSLYLVGDVRPVFTQHWSTYVDRSLVAAGGEAIRRLGG